MPAKATGALRSSEAAAALAAAANLLKQRRAIPIIATSVHYQATKQANDRSRYARLDGGSVACASAVRSKGVLEPRPAFRLIRESRSRPLEVLSKLGKIQLGNA